LKIIQLGAERGRYAALKEGIVDVAVLSPPTDTDAQRNGFRVLSRFYELYKLPFTGIGANLKKLKEKPDEVKRMIRAMLKANRFVRANREGTIQTMMDWIKVDRESARRLRFDLEDLQRRRQHFGKWPEAGRRPGP